MQRQRDGWVPVAEALAVLPGSAQALRETPPPARRGFTLADQVDRLVAASEADPDRGFMARTMALCSLPRTNPGNRYRYVRRNGPYTLVMSADGLYKLPFGNLPRLILAWVCTEAVRTGRREIVLARIQISCIIRLKAHRLKRKRDDLATSDDGRVANRDEGSAAGEAPVTKRSGGKMRAGQTSQADPCPLAQLLADRMSPDSAVPVEQKGFLNLKEAAEYSGLQGEHRSLSAVFNSAPKVII